MSQFDFTPLLPLWALLLLVSMPFVAIVAWGFAARFDRDRIRDHARSRGCSVRSIQREWFGPGWYGSRYERIYKVRYTDTVGNLHETYAKTNAHAGVYFTDDRIVQKAAEQVSLEEENRRLREENERLRGEGRKA